MKKFSDLVETEKQNSQIKSEKRLYDQQLVSDYILNLKKELGLIENELNEQQVAGISQKETSETIEHNFPLKKVRSSETATPREKQLAHFFINMHSKKS